MVPLTGNSGSIDGQWKRYCRLTFCNTTKTFTGKTRPNSRSRDQMITQPYHVQQLANMSVTRVPFTNKATQPSIRAADLHSSERATCKRSTSEPNSNCPAAKTAIALKTTPATTRSVRGECAVQKSACCEALINTAPPLLPD